MSKPFKGNRFQQRPFQGGFGKSSASPVTDHLQIARDSKDKTRHSTGVIYHEYMKEPKCLWDENYPENPSRFTSVLDRCKELGLLERCVSLSPREVTEDELLRVHTADRIELLKGTDGSPDAEALEALSSGYDAIYIHPTSYKASLLAAGSTVELVDAILDEKVQNGMAIVRPPGHHAMQSEYCGYCFYNNVAVAARHALDIKGLSRILIVDWDVHHGQATQQMFYDDPRVLYFSIHRYENGSFWPNLRESDYHFIGSGPGKGYNVNIPLNKTQMGNADYMAVFHQVLLPLANEFQPELVIVSAGYDAALGCFEGEMEVTPACYAHLTSALMGLAYGKIAVVLEGGYCLKSLAEGAALTLRTLLGDPCPQIENLAEPSESIRESILSAIYVLRDYWNCFKFQETFCVDHVRNPKNVQPGQFWPVLKFLGSDEKSTKFATRNCYPVQSEELVKHLDQRLDVLIRGTSLTVPPNRVCLVYDEAMAKHRNISEQNHPERPQRILTIYERLEEFGLTDRVHRLKSREATREELLMLHDKDYLDTLYEIPQLKQSQLNEMQRKYNSIFICPDSLSAALISSGCALQVVDTILNGESRSGVAVIRPPGHHAERDEAYGFCFFNNTALAAKHAIEAHGLKRILIVDWDVHHGNGIQRMFENDPRVLYVSLHRGDIFPMNPEDSACCVVGEGHGAGYSVNISWPKKGMGDAEYLAAFQQVVMPIAYQYNPELVLVAAGFDAAQGDPLGGCLVTPQCYGQLTHMLSSLASGRVALFLEGGYNLNSISYSFAMCTKALLGDPIPSPAITQAINPAAVATIKSVVRAQQPFWSSLKFHVQLPDKNVLSAPWVTGKESLEQGLEKLNLSEAEVGACAALEVTLSPQEPRTLTEFLALPENAIGLAEGSMFAVTPLSWCPHLVSVGESSCKDWSSTLPCGICADPGENWLCLTCYEVRCGRFVNGHMLDHNTETGHPLALSFSDLSVWCYSCDSYIDNKAFYAAKNKLHLEKFGEPLPH